ncbi:MAG: TRAP transporter large permease subunit, partial [Deltaproteobacteria bacterium]|nr:TRAP transporter large permease subunit [Deltaproteobacteria bacterium]
MLSLALVALLLLSAPLFLLIGAMTALGYTLFEGTPLTEIAFAESLRKLTDKPPLLAIPFFVLSGSIMSRGAIAERLVSVARAAFAGLPGGIGVATVIACMFFAAISGSSPVTVITIGGVMYPALVKAGYTERFATGLVTSAGTLGILIPPSIPMIVYAIFASGTHVIQVEDLFLAGVGPGVLIGILLSLYCLRDGLQRGERFHKSGEPLVERFVEGFWSLMLPVVILGGIYSGLFTATEAAAVSVVYSLVVELWIHRSLKVSDLPGVVGESTVLMGSLLVIFAMAVGLNDLLAELALPDKAVAWIQTQQLTPVTFLLILNGFLLIVGCLMDIMSAIMILVPLLAPMAAAYGIDPIHLGIIFIVNLELGYLTPPMGLNLFVSSSLFHKPVGEVVRSVVPFMGILAVALLLVTYIPTIALGPVRALRG